MSIGYKVPALAHMESGPQKKMWKNNIGVRQKRITMISKFKLEAESTNKQLNLLVTKYL